MPGLCRSRLSRKPANFTVAGFLLPSPRPVARLARGGITFSSSPPVTAFIQGLILGFSIAAPVGPIGLLCLRRSLANGRLAGLISGLGAATADAFYGLLAALGLTALSNFLLEYQSALQLSGGLFLLYVGLTTLRTRPAAIAATAPASSHLGSAYLTTLLLTLSNPLTILSFLALFTGLPAGTASPHDATTLVLGVFLGSAAWWLLLSCSAAALSSRLSHGGLRFLNVTSGLVLLAFGLWQLRRLL